MWPVPAGRRNRQRLSSRRRAKIERQTAVVHAAGLPASVRTLLAEQAAEAERLEICSELARVGRAVMGSHPLGWAATILLAVAYAHVLIELAAIVLAGMVLVRLAWSHRNTASGLVGRFPRVQITVTSAGAKRTGDRALGRGNGE